MPRTITSRADLLRCAGKGIGLVEAAGVLGFRGRLSEAPSRMDLAWRDQPSVSVSETDTTPEPAPKFEFPSERPRLTFLRAVTAETFKSETVRQKVGNPISDAQLAVDWSKSGPALPPLTRWARLSPFLHQRLGCNVPGLRLNERKLMKEVGKGLPLVALPRRLQRVWAPQAMVLWDFTPEMFPFAKDVRWLVGRLQRERGKHGLDLRLVRSLPSKRHLRGIPTGAPVLALSSMGQYENSPSVGAAWTALGRKLTHLGHQITALMPCPRESWDSQLANVWPSAVWDRRPRLPRHGGLWPRAGRELSGEMGVEQLLDFLSPASRMESPLMRTARLKLGPVADVGTEWRAWHHPDLWSSLDSCGFTAGKKYEQRLERRRSLTGQDAHLAREIGELMEAHHEQCSVVIAAEARLRACLTGGMETSTLEEVKSLLTQVVDRLRQMAPEPGAGAGKDSGLAPWFIGMVDRLDEAMRKDSEVAELITNGLAYAHSFEETDHVILPGGIEPEAFAKATREVAKQIQPRDYRIELRAENEWRADLGLAAGKGLGAVARPPLEPLRTSLLVSSRPLQFQHGEETHRLQLRGSSCKPLATLGAADGFSLESDVQKITFQPTKRPSWANRMWYDRYGLAAEFLVGKVPFVLRWIPPGRFTMGSPEDEVGRFEREGPQHEVTISRGYWLGETPVTQAQWRAVVDQEIAGNLMWNFYRQDELKNPSYLKGSPMLPVENVSWLECLDFCGLLNRLMNAPDLHFHIPSEAQWEYACRAGTETAFNDGSACTEPEGADPALAQVGWFHNNSWGKTHVVKEKNAPNAWGLHDMHGNVWEWCADAWDAESYKKRAEGVTDPHHDSTHNNAHRVLRGGSWGGFARNCRSACRFGYHPGLQWADRGIRLAAGQELGGGATGSGAPSAGEAEPSRGAGEIVPKKRKR